MGPGVFGAECRANKFRAIQPVWVTFTKAPYQLRDKGAYGYTNTAMVAIQTITEFSFFYSEAH